MASGTARSLVLWCRDWPVVAAGAAAGAAPSDQVAVVHAGRVVACSAAAQAEGVAPGLRRREAQARCPALELVAHDPARDARAFEPVLLAVEALTPRVEVLAPGEAAFPARGAARYHGGEAVLAAKVAMAVDGVLGGRGHCQVGIADGVFAAGLAARVGLAVGDRDRGQAEDRAQAQGLAQAPATARHSVVIPPGGSSGFLAAFPVGTLGRPALADLLVRLGLGTLGDLAAQPRATLAARFGPEGIRAHRLASGLDERPRAARRPPPELAVVAELDPPADRVDVAAFAAKALADELAERLDHLGLACTSLRIEGETEHGESLTRRWRLPDEGSRVAAMVERVRWQLDGWLSGAAANRSDASGGLIRLLLAPEQVAPDQGRQLGFWGERSAASRRAARGLARVQGLLGADAVRTATLRGGRSPADQVAFGSDAATPTAATPTAAAPAAPTAPTAPAAPWPGRLRAPSPAIVHPEPLPAEVLDGGGAPVTVSGRGLLSAPPASLHPRGVTRGTASDSATTATATPARITAWAGPWPVDERWWDPKAHRRVARLQVLTSEGVAHLLKLNGGRWWIEATYD